MKSLVRALFSSFLGLSLVLCAGASGCSSNAQPDAGAPDAGETLGPVAVPEGLLGEAFIPSPDAAWSRARELIGPPAAFVPQSFGGLVSTFFNLPITVAGEIDGKVPTVGAIVASAKDGPARFTLGIHVKAGDRFLDQLTKGEGARFTATLDPATHVQVLDPKTGGKGPALGVLGNYLLIAVRTEDLLAIGPYVARNMPSAPQPKEDVVIEVPERALSGPVMARARTQWDRIRENAKREQTPVLFEDKVERLISILGDSEHARVTIDFAPDALHARATLTPKAGNGPATKALTDILTGDTKPLLDLPADAILAVVYRESSASRAANAPAQADALASISGKETSPADKETITAAVTEASQAMGDWAALGVTLGPKGPGAFGRIPVTDQEKFDKALHDAFALTKLDALKQRFKESELEVSVDKTVVENLPGDVQRVRFSKTGDKDKAKGKAKEGDKAKNAKADSPDADLPSKIDLLVLVQKESAFFGVGFDSKEALRNVVHAPTEGNLGGNPKIKKALDALGDETSFALFADPMRFVAARSGKPPPAEPAPVVVGLGKKDKALFGRLDISQATIEEVIKHRNLF